MKKTLFEKLFLRDKFDFFKLLLEQSEKVENGVKYLNEYIKTFDESKAQEVERYEEEADEIRRIIINQLNKTFITPIDREDIFALSRAVDDVVDYAKSTVEEIKLFDAKPTNYMITIVEALYNGTRELTLAIKNMRDYPLVAQEHVIRAKKTENFIEHRYREGLSELFKLDDVKTILKLREIYRHLSNAADRLGESADIVSDIIVKIT